MRARHCGRHTRGAPDRLRAPPRAPQPASVLPPRPELSGAFSETVVGAVFQDSAASQRAAPVRCGLRPIEQTVEKFASSDKRLSHRSTIPILFARPGVHSHPHSTCSSAPSRARPPSRTRGAGAHPPAAGASPRSRAASTRSTWMNSVRAARQKDVSSVSLNGLDAREGGVERERETRSSASFDRALTLHVPHHPPNANDSQGSRAQRAVPGARAPRPGAARARARGAL